MKDWIYDLYVHEYLLKTNKDDNEQDDTNSEQAEL